MEAGTWRRPTREDSDSMKTGRSTEKLRIWCSSLDSNIFWGGCRRVGWSPRILPLWSAATSKSTTCSTSEPSFAKASHRCHVHRCYIIIVLDYHEEPNASRFKYCWHHLLFHCNKWAVQHSGEIGSATFRGTDLCCAAGEAKSTEGITGKRDACWKSLSNDLASVISEAVQQLPLP